MEQRGRVLIVDDNEMNVDVLRRILRKDYELESATTGEECLAKLPAFKPQLVLLDIMMPGIDGYETCRQIKCGPLGDFAQVILVSGKGTTADRVQGYEALADDYIVKPFDHKELLSKVRAHFRLRNMQGDSAHPTASDALARLCGVVKQMSADISEHSELIEEISRELNSCEKPSPDALIHSTVRLANTNRATQERLAAAERKLREQAQEIESHASEARTDALTLLPNRRAFDEELSRRIAEASRTDHCLCAVMIDIDHFKLFNDVYGHPAGDEVLQAVGRVLVRTSRQMDLVARFGGDEFVALLPGASLENAKASARRIQQVMEKSILHVEDQTLQVTASIGLAQRLPDEDGLSLIKRADDAMYASKKAGRNCIHWHDGNEAHPVQSAEAPPTSQARDERLPQSPPPVPHSEITSSEITPSPSTP